MTGLKRGVLLSYPRGVAPPKRIVALLHFLTVIADAVPSSELLCLSAKKTFAVARSLSRRIPPHDLTDKKALRDARAAEVASNTTKGICVEYAWRHRAIEREGRLSAPRRPFEELKTYSGPNAANCTLQARQAASVSTKR